MASLEIQLLDRCMNLVHGVIALNQELEVKVAIGENFMFEFSNMEKKCLNNIRKISPNQKRRNDQRKINYEQNKLLIGKQKYCKGDSIKVKEDVEFKTAEEEVQVSV